MATDKEKIEQLLRQKTINDVALAGYMMFLNDKNMLAPAEEYVKGFLKCFTNEEMEKIFEQKKAVFEKEIAEYDNKRGSQ